MNRMENFWSDGAEIPVRAPATVDGAWDWQRQKAPERSSSHRETSQAERTAFTTREPVSPVGPRYAPAIVLENLTKKYNAHFAVDNVSFYVPKGATLGLLGGNGAGKTTTIAMIMGLVIPTSGSARAPWRSSC
jgi:ABC-type glutathione transport system ATPase component